RIRVRRGRGASPGRRGPHAGAARPNAPGGTEPVAGRHGAGTHAAGARQAQGPQGRRGSGARDQPLHPVASPLRLPPALKARAPPEPEKATPEGTRDRSPVGRGPGSISNVALPGAPGSPPDDQRPRARCYLATIGDALPHRPPKTNSSSGFRRLGARSRSLSAPGNPFGSHGAVYAGLLHARQPPVHARPIGLVVRTE